MNIWGHVGAEWGGQKPLRSRLRGSEGSGEGVGWWSVFWVGGGVNKMYGGEGVGGAGGGLGGKMKETGGRWRPVRGTKSVIKMRAEEK